MSSPAVLASPATASPVEIDTELARIYNRTVQLEIAAKAAADQIERAAQTGRGRYAAADAELRLGVYNDQLRNLRAEQGPLEAVFSARRWHRYFLVTNAGGHVHRDMNCVTCYPTTEYYWIVDLADCDEAAMVVEYGEKACTVCFPDAPANPSYHGPGRRDAAARAERDAEKAAKAAAKAEKELLAPVRVDYDTVRTVVAARNKAKDCYRNLGWYGAGHPTAAAWIQGIKDLRVALEAKGVDVDALVAKWEPQIRKETGAWMSVA